MPGRSKGEPGGGTLLSEGRVVWRLVCFGKMLRMALRPLHPSGCNSFFPFRGPNIGIHLSLLSLLSKVRIAS